MEAHLTKHCPDCDKELTIDLFNKNKYKKDGLDRICKYCSRLYKNKYYSNHKDKSINYIKNNKKKIQDRQNKWEKENRDKRNIIVRRWKGKNPEYFNKNYRKRYILNIEFRILNCLRARVYSCLKSKRTNKTNTTIELISCSMKDLKIYLESKFKEGMSWDNYGKGEGKWNIDHIRPCASFDLTDPQQQKLCFHYTNLQPLWSKDNLSKGSLHEGKRHYKNKKITIC